jgi:hypothetical protein
MSNTTNTTKGKEILTHVSLKNVKSGVGHDLAGLYCDFYLDGKKMGYLNDDGRGGDVDIVYMSKDTQKTFEKFLLDNQVAQLMFENGWSFMGNVNKIDLNTQAQEIIDGAFNQKEAEKVNKKIQKICLSNIAWGTDFYYKSRGYKSPMSELIIKHGDKAKNSIQSLYNEIKTQLQPGERIFNTNLESLGIVM